MVWIFNRGANIRFILFDFASIIMHERLTERQAYGLQMGLEI
jgi:hypothetical protein